tara:strand:+ start:161 stop:1459 length:1299 start_codon:yes stop_codon:yes gene_type:complete
VNRIIILIIVLFLINNCSLNESSKLWKDKENKVKNQKNIQKIISKDQEIVEELNPDLSLQISDIKTNNKIYDNKNNYGSQKYEGNLNKVGQYKFSKLEGISQLNFKPIFLNDGLIFFDKKGSIIRYNDSKKVLWKKNFYSKVEKKLKPKINFIKNNEDIIITDNISKYYSININSGELNWSKSNTYPFNSEAKIYKDKFFVIDYKNTLRCFKINDGSECWKLKTEESFTISNSRLSLIISNDLVIFTNSLGDITATDIETGLILWQLPTQSSNIINETYNFKISKLVSDNQSIIFSNNKNEFYSIDVKTGTINWINKINSNITPIIIDNLIFTVSNNGYLFVIDKKKGNIVRITDLFKDYKSKKKNDIKPIGFAIGNANLYLTNTDGKMIVSNLSLGNIIRIEKISGDFTSKPFIFNQNLFVIKNGSIVQYN